MSAAPPKAPRRRRRLGRALALGLAALLPWLLWPEARPRATGAWFAAAGVEPQRARVAGIELRYVRRGSGPPVVLLHGFASSIYTWAEVIPALAAQHDVVALDFPGFGGSEAPASLAAELLPRVTLGLLDALGLERASLVGNSMGGAVAVELATRVPGRVERLVLIDAAGYNLAPGTRPPLLRLMASGPARVLGERLPLRRLTRRALREVFADDARVTPERVEEYLAPLRRPGALASAQSLLLSLAALSDLPQRVPQVRARTLVVWGREDRWIPLEQGERFAREIPGARLVVLDGIGHLPQEEAPEELARLLLEFLAEPTPAPF